jgi:hypothetical protein
MNINEDRNQIEQPQIKVSFREWLALMDNIQFQDRAILCEGEILNDDLFTETMDNWEDKGYAIPEEEHFTSSVLELMQEIVINQFHQKFLEMDIDMSDLYNQWISNYYQ